FVLIDPDHLSASNTTRVYGSTPQDVDRPKVDVLGDHLERIATGVRAARIQGSILSEDVARVLAGVDVVFGCTDDNAGRLRLSRLPYFHLVPVIDCGVLLDATGDGLIRGIFGRVTVAHPGAACLMCRGRVDIGRAEAETRTDSEQRRLEKEGYAPALPGVEPAVVAFTTMVAAAAVSELLERLVGYGDPDRPSEVLLRIHDRAVSVNDAHPQTGHYCDPSRPCIGTDGEMYLGLNWAS
ncbi:ThiF family adenylyltransferase, partial [Bacillus subtilis]|uniref:HesA/MoeB/ThiF family protein n=1 Tax=Bacillus subtilis TaxID=1423 RepID=UPI0035D880D2